MAHFIMTYFITILWPIVAIYKKSNDDKTFEKFRLPGLSLVPKVRPMNKSGRRMNEVGPFFLFLFLFEIGQI